ncbi:YbaB/EbfC family nucleoid-associated protein [Nocardia sp. NBC_01503]|uniref:YbaB/EbfC family nucleoid-associated protein n=1 Tax=Nocardia sp. NBC_01503 TaxID=2975997 RepID=UPI002E7B3680|nr:YbaB/EbfC family nucleoid-associated protein [Nocardia sp. NBC_01503]WTL29564.1 YbaB/EbfC family nucleoid-associated protein [Nocardia sp. NBC_01503]
MDDEFASAVGDFKKQVAEVARVRAECAQLMGTGTAERRRVRVTVNADGIAIDIKFAADIGDLSYDEIAAAVTAASRSAVVEVAQRRKELMAPIAAQATAAPKMEDILAAVDSLRDQLS